MRNGWHRLRQRRPSRARAEGRIMLITVSDGAYQLIMELAGRGEAGFGACQECRALILDEECPEVAATEERFLCPACAAKAAGPQAS